MTFDKKYLLCALAYAAAGMGLGAFMGASHDHSQFIAHAHMLLVGFVVSFIYSVVHKLWLGGTRSGLARTQFVVHQAGALTMVVSLLLLYGSVLPVAVLDPVLGFSSIAVLLGAL